MIFKNARGQEAAPPQPPPVDGPFKGDPHRAIPELDFKRCQTVFLTPTRNNEGQIIANSRRCDRPPTYVMVENEPRSSHGKIHSMAICDQCAKGVLIAQGPNYALFTPLTDYKKAPL